MLARVDRLSAPERSAVEHGAVALDGGVAGRGRGDHDGELGQPRTQGLELGCRDPLALRLLCSRLRRHAREELEQLVVAGDGSGQLAPLGLALGEREQHAGLRIKPIAFRELGARRVEAPGLHVGEPSIELRLRGIRDARARSRAGDGEQRASHQSAARDHEGAPGAV